MIPILAAIIVLVTTGLFVWSISSFLDAIARFRGTERWDEQSADIGR